MIRQMRPWPAAQYSRFVAAGVAQVNPVQAQQRKPRRIGFGRTTVVTFEGFVQVVTAGEGGVALQLPVVEVAGLVSTRILKVFAQKNAWAALQWRGALL